MSDNPDKTITDQPPLFSHGYTNYVLGVLVIVYVFNFIDRQILAILAPAIKTDLLLSDTQIGALSGVAFGIFYATLGIPIARLADRYSRVNIIAISLTIWSLMTALSGLAVNYWQLLIARIGVGIGEAGGSPPSHSMISDMFPADQRATALAIYALGIPIGTMLGNLGGGWISETFEWRTAFWVVGLPGVMLALIVRFTLKEPTRGAAEGITVDPADAPPVAEVFKTLWNRKSFKLLAFGGALHANTPAPP